MDLLSKEGTIAKVEGGYLIRVRGKTHVKDLPGVECENPRAKEERRVYRKLFTKKRIYLAHEYERAVQEVLRGTDVIVLGMNGYSELTAEQCALWGVTFGAYEQACVGILKMLHKTLNQKFKDVDIRFADGASAASGGGVDWAIIQAARDLNCQHLGHSCPKFMFYVLDDEDPVYVAETQVEYANSFIDSLDILVAANGRMQAFRHDIMAVFEKLKYLIPVNVLKSLSTNGGMPAIDASGKIEDAVATYEQRVHLIGQRIIHTSSDPYSDLVANICNEAVGIVRPLLSPKRAYGNIASE